VKAFFIGVKGKLSKIINRTAKLLSQSVVEVIAVEVLPKELPLFFVIIFLLAEYILIMF